MFSNIKAMETYSNDYCSKGLILLIHIRVNKME
jgi:hypothetical protein